MGCFSSKDGNDDSEGGSNNSGRAAVRSSLNNNARALGVTNGASESLVKIAQSFEAKYQLGKELGHGSFSTVREGVHKTTNKRYAVKCVKRADFPPEDEADLKMEVNLLRKMNHENIVKLYDFYEENNFYYLVMEILDGGELFDRIVRKQYYNEREARDVLVVLFNAIKYCHDMDVAHRDIKPENLLLVSEENDATIKLADFGFARPVGEKGLVAQCGTPGYVAPEILKGEVYGKPVDLWSIGVIMYILLGGYPPFHDDNQAKLYQKIKKGNVSFHPQYWSTVSDEAKDLIRRMLTVDKEKRISAEEALAHPWMGGEAEELEKRDLGKNMDQLRLFNVRRKFKAAISSVIAAQRMSSMANVMTADRRNRTADMPPAPPSAHEEAEMHAASLVESIATQPVPPL